MQMVISPGLLLTSVFTSPTSSPGDTWGGGLTPMRRFASEFYLALLIFGETPDCNRGENKEGPVNIDR